MKKLRLLMCVGLAGFTVLQFSCSSKQEKDVALWQEDFQYQPIAARPQLEVTYTDSSRTAFEIAAQEYNLVGQLRKPHMLVNKTDSAPWLWIEMEDAAGVKYST